VKLKLLALLAALLLVFGAAACSSDDSSSGDDTTTTEEEDEETTTTEEEEEEEEPDADAAEAALEKVERNFGLTKREPDDTTDETTDDTTDDTTTDTGDLGIEGLSEDEQACLLDALAADPALLELAESIDSASVEEQAALLDVMFQCIDPSILGTVFAQGIAESSPSVTAEQAQCLGEGFVELTPESIAEFLIINSDPTYTPSDQAVQEALDLFLSCEVDPTTL